MDGCAAELDGLFSTIRYTQRGTPPSTVGPPYSIESHMADALAVLDALGVARAWAIGHSWGGHLALHLLAAHPERLLGVICIGTLGAHGEIFREFGENLRRGLTPAQVSRLDEVEALRRSGAATEPDLTERKMFGGLCLMAGGHMFCGILGEELMLRLGPDAAEAALERPHVRAGDLHGAAQGHGLRRACRVPRRAGTARLARPGSRLRGDATAEVGPARRVARAPPTIAGRLRAPSDRVPA